MTVQEETSQVAPRNRAERRAVRSVERRAVRSGKRFMPIPDWCEYSGMSRSGTYLAIGRRDIDAVKMGRSTLVDVESGDRYLDSLPAANIRPSAA